MKNSKKKTSIGNILRMTLLYILTIGFIFPFYWVITGGFKQQEVTVQLPPQWFPIHPTIENYRKLFYNPALTWFFNSVLIALGTMILVCVVSTMAGYVLAKKKFYGRELIFAILVAAMALPKQVILVPLVRLISSWGFHNTLSAVILPAVGWPFGVFLMKQFNETLPTEILEAAKIDGSSELKTFILIVVPMVKPGIAALAIFTFIGAWNDYFMQLIMLNSKLKLTLPLGVATMQQEFATNYGVLMAGATFAAVPILIVFIAFQKYFTQGITMGAVKG
ncbi:MAG TPA: sugar ABC transporter permease [Firmicutes bacterium]|jgi:multiple sugar transport system permease protein|nr:sugar ABC transporter permease [Bacillota bacterium]